MANIKETKEAVIAVAKFYKLGKEVLADGKISLGDIPAVVSAAPSLYTSTLVAVEGGEKIPAEFKDISPEELGELASAVIAEFQVADEKALAIIAASLKLISAGTELVKAL